MSDTIDDVGIHNYDAVLSGEYSYNIADRILTFNDLSAEADSRYILPQTSEWFLAEVYDINGVYGSLGYHKLSLNVADLSVFLSSTWTTAVNAYSSFKIIVTHYYGNYTADTYYGDETSPATLYCSGVDFTPDTESWKLSIDTLIPMPPPIYLLTEPIITVFGSPDRYYVNNSSCSADVFDGALEHSFRSDLSEGTPWLPTSGQYPQDGTIELFTSGGSVHRIDTQWIPQKNSEWTITGIYNVVMGSSYDMYAIHYKGNGYADIYVGSSTSTIQLEYENVTYTPQSTAWVIGEEPPTEITLDKITYNMDNFYEA